MLSIIFDLFSILRMQQIQVQGESLGPFLRISVNTEFRSLLAVVWVKEKLMKIGKLSKHKK